MEPGRQGRQRAPESIRKQKRRELDARRSKCRIRIGRHLEQWCTLKERLGFSLHSQLAKYLLDWYSSQGCVLSAEQGGSLPTDALQRLVALSHAHSQECSVLPAVKTPAAGETGAPWSLVWECLAGHTFSWGPPAGAEQGRAPPAAGGQPCRAASRRRKEREGSSQPSPPPSPVASRRRSLRQAALARDASGAAVKAEASPTGNSAAVQETEVPSPAGSTDHGTELGAGSAGAEAAPLERAESGTEGTEPESAPGLENRSEEAPAPPEDEDEDFTEEDDLVYTDDLRDENYHPSLDRACEGPFPGLASSVIGEPPVPAWNLFLRPSCPSSDSELQRECSQDKCSKSPVKGVRRPSEPGPDDDSPPEEKAAQFSQCGASRKRRNETSEEQERDSSKTAPHPGASVPLETTHLLAGLCKKRRLPSDEDVAQIGPKRIRKAAKREILLCEFEGCGKIFSNRQYLNHHKKYQHVHQKTFTCSEPSCGKSFNFKKHLKEHEKLHSDKRDYICEFCARSFRTSSNLIIHRRIHTGEKPLQCEICGFTCRQKASLNWHMRKHDADAFYLFSCELCGKKFEKRDNVTAHKSKSHPWAAAAAATAAGPAPPPPLPDGPSPCCRRPPAAALSPCKLEEEEVPVAGE